MTILDSPVLLGILWPKMSGIGIFQSFPFRGQPKPMTFIDLPVSSIYDSRRMVRHSRRTLWGESSH